jgi:hypothetical protein
VVGDAGDPRPTGLEQLQDPLHQGIGQVQAVLVAKWSRSPHSAPPPGWDPLAGPEPEYVLDETVSW